MKVYRTVDAAREDITKRIEQLKVQQPLLNAVVSIVDIEDQLSLMNAEGAMSGVAIALKDNVNTKGVKTTGSSKILENYIPIYDAHITKKLKDAGAIVVAKTSMDELGMGGTNLNAATGPVSNPWDLSRISGGSSGGSAALVASGAVSFAIGSDTGDSVRKPAAYCGIVGVKPTYGRISRYGIIPYASSLDHVGYFTTNVHDAAIALEVLAGRDSKDMTSSFEEVPQYTKEIQNDIEGKTIGVIQEIVESIENQEIRTSFQNLLGELEKKGAIIKKISFNKELLRVCLPTYYLIANCEATANHANLDGLRFGVQQMGNSAEEIMIHSRTEGFGLYLRKRLMVGSFGLFVENQEKLFKKAQRIRRLIVNELSKSLEGVDCLLAPATPGIAPKLDAQPVQDFMSDESLIADTYMVLANFSGYPSMTVPTGFIEGCPIGVNLTSKAFDEGNLFNIGAKIEEITGLKDQVAEVKKA